MGTPMKKRQNKQPSRKNTGRRSSNRRKKANNILPAALAYLESGLSFIPIAADGSKKPEFRLVRRWSEFKDRQPTESEVHRWFGENCASREVGLAIIGGAVSGGLEIIDIDSYDQVEPWAAKIEKMCPGLLNRLVRVRSPRPGEHVYFRSEKAGGNVKLARLATQTLGSKKWTPKTVIEVKGTGGYCLAPPSPAACHPTGRCYEFLGKDLTEVPTITEDEREVLFAAARSLDTWVDRRKSVPRRSSSHKRNRYGSLRPGDDFNNRADWSDILVPHGWQLVGENGDEVDYWRRPGDDEGHHASTNFGGSDLLFVFSTQAPPFEEETAYCKFHAYALLEHDGDFEAAASELRDEGYGSYSFRQAARGNPYEGAKLYSHHGSDRNDQQQDRDPQTKSH
jgi:hypothetical protein